MDKDKKESKISSVTAFFMIFVTIFFDAILLVISLFDLIPVVGWIFGLLIGGLISGFAWMTFFMWFKSKGVEFKSTKHYATWICGFVFGAIPFLDIIAWTVTIAIMIGIIWAEEGKLLNSKLAKIGATAVAGPEGAAALRTANQVLRMRKQREQAITEQSIEQDIQKNPRVVYNNE